MRRVVGFDLDMTLIDSRAQILGAFDALATERRVAIDLAAVQARLGIKLEDELSHWFEEDEIPAAAALYRSHYVRLAPATVLLPGALEALEAVREVGDRVVIITAKHETSVKACLAATGITADNLFSFVHGPEKAVVLAKLDAHLYIGDTPDDMRAAKTAGVIGVGVATGVFDREELIHAGAHLVLLSLVSFADALALLA